MRCCESTDHVSLRFDIPAAPPADDRKTIREALEFAVDFAQGSRKWSDGWRGIQAFQVWIRVVEIGYAPAFGLAFNAAVWAECRKFAVKFLQKARSRLNSPTLDPLWVEALANIASEHET